MAVSGEEPKALDDTIPAREKDDGTKPSDPAQAQPVSSPPSRHSSPTTPPPPGQDRYEVRSELGRGGMGRVVEAFDVQLGRIVALKEVLPKAGTASARRFAREVTLTAKLEHPSIVPLYDSGTTQDGRPYYVMRKVTGRPLDELILRSRKLDDRLALLPHVQAAIDAVAHAHARGVIHRDLKPANILVGEHGETVVIDWGLAKVIGEPDDPATRDSMPSDSLQTQMGSVFGTPGFMAPEQARGDEIGTHGDVYALGATLYQLLAGTPPHSGNSATAVIEKTLKHTMVPLMEIAPGAPAELATIVTKALSHEPEHRYPHAGALGEDLRRFSTGQLVAAHRYTTLQRFARFAKKHRAVLAVATLATIALFTLALFSVKRIVHERDVATHARVNAETSRNAAVEATRKLERERDALLVAKARSRIDLNPTEALATLKNLPANTSQLDEARAVAQAATLRGVTWAIQSTPVYTFIAEISPDTKHLLQVSRDGMIRVWDLGKRKLDLARPFAANTRAIWIADGKLLVTKNDAPPAILDPNTNTVENLTIDPISMAYASDNGERVVFEGKTGAGTFDTRSRTVKMFTAEPKITGIEIAPDGNAMGYTTPKETIIVAPDGREIARLPRSVRMTFSPSNIVAILAENRIFELDLSAAKPEVHEVLPPGDRRDIILDLVYAGRDLVVMAGLHVWTWNGARSFNRAELDTASGGMYVAEGNYVLVASVDNKVNFLDQVAAGSIQLPANLHNTRLVSRSNSPLVLVVAEGIILGFDLDLLRPTIIKTSGDTFATFIDDDTLIAAHSVDQSWDWVDIATGKMTHVELETFGLAMISDIDPAGRVLLSVGGVKGNTLYLLHKGSTKPKLLVQAENAWGRLVPGNGVVWFDGNAKLLGSIDDGPPREIAKVNGIPDNAASIGHLKVAVHSTSGELLRVDMVSGNIERTTIALGSRFFLNGEQGTGRVLVAEDNRVMVWDTGGVTEVAHFDGPVRRLLPMQGGVAVVLDSNETFVIDAKPGAIPMRVSPPSRVEPRTSLDGHLLVSIGNAEQVTVLELPARARWTLPKYHRFFGTTLANVSPSKRRLLQHTYGAVVIWDLPQAPAQDFASWLEEQTNARVDTDGELIWPWQTPNPK